MSTERTEVMARAAGGPVTASELARRVSEAADAYQTTGARAALRELEALAVAAADLVRGVGEGTVDHIVLSSILGLVVREVPQLERVLANAGWRWLK